MSVERRSRVIRPSPRPSPLYCQFIQLLWKIPEAVPFQRFESVLLFPSPVLIIIVPLLDLGCYALELSQVAIDGRRCCIEGLPVVRLVLLRVSLELLKDQVCMSIQQEICLCVIAFGFVDLRLDRVSSSSNGRAATKRTSFCMVLAVRSQFDSGMCALYV